MTNRAGDFAAAWTRDLCLRSEGPPHPEDLASLRHGDATTLWRRRVRDRASLFEGLLRSELSAVRAMRRRPGSDAHAGESEVCSRKRMIELRSSALAHLLACAC